MTYSSTQQLLRLRNDCLELPAENEVVSWAQWAVPGLLFCPRHGVGKDHHVISGLRGQKCSSVLGGAGMAKLGMCLEEDGGLRGIGPDPSPNQGSFHTHLQQAGWGLIF